MSTTANLPEQLSTTAPPNSDAPTTLPPEWTETDYITSLARLESLQTRIDSLRLTVPSLVRTLASPHPTPDALFKEFQKATLGPMKSLVELRRVLETKETRDIMEHTRKGFGEVVDVEAEGLAAYLKPLETYGWAEELEKINKEAEEKAGGEKEGESDAIVLGDDEIEARLKEYMEKYEAVKGAEWDKEGKVATVRRHGECISVLAVTNQKVDQSTISHRPSIILCQTNHEGEPSFVRSERTIHQREPTRFKCSFQSH
jgi:hypothetical protein